jgi:hypothetical protein
MYNSLFEISHNQKERWNYLTKYPEEKQRCNPQNKNIANPKMYQTFKKKIKIKKTL